MKVFPSVFFSVFFIYCSACSQDIGSFARDLEEVVKSALSKEFIPDAEAAEIERRVFRGSRSNGGSVLEIRTEGEFDLFWPWEVKSITWGRKLKSSRLFRIKSSGNEMYTFVGDHLGYFEEDWGAIFDQNRAAASVKNYVESRNGGVENLSRIISEYERLTDWGLARKIMGASYSSLSKSKSFHEAIDRSLLLCLSRHWFYASRYYYLGENDSGYKVLVFRNKNTTSGQLLLFVCFFDDAGRYVMQGALQISDLPNSLYELDELLGTIFGAGFDLGFRDIEIE